MSSGTRAVSVLALGITHDAWPIDNCKIAQFLARWRCVILRSA
jgi:hypothetical protein